MSILQKVPKWFLVSKAIDFLKYDGGNSNAKYNPLKILSSWELPVEISMVLGKLQLFIHSHIRQLVLGTKDKTGGVSALLELLELKTMKMC